MKRYCMTTKNEFKIIFKEKNQSPFSTHDYRHISFVLSSHACSKKIVKISIVGRMLKDRKIHRQPRRSEAFYKRRRDENWSEGAKKDEGEKKAKQQL